MGPMKTRAFSLVELMIALAMATAISAAALMASAQIGRVMSDTRRRVIVLDEAKRISRGDGDAAASASATATGQALTSLDIHKALKRLLPGEPGDSLRPYLPAVTKQAWHLDKQSLKGVKRHKVGPGAAAAAPPAQPASPADEGAPENVPPPV